MACRGGNIVAESMESDNLMEISVQLDIMSTSVATQWRRINFADEKMNDSWKVGLSARVLSR